jgi:hypothetical protein
MRKFAGRDEIQNVSDRSGLIWRHVQRPRKFSIIGFDKLKYTTDNVVALIESEAWGRGYSFLTVLRVE